MGWNSLLCGVCADTSHACCVAVPEGTEPASAGGEDQCRIKRRRSLLDRKSFGSSYFKENFTF